MFDYRVDKMKKSANDDEIGLTNYVTVGLNEVMAPSSDSVSEHIGHNHSIAVHSKVLRNQPHHGRRGRDFMRYHAARRPYGLWMGCHTRWYWHTSPPVNNGDDD
jgi:hypothetical protein